MLDPAIMEIKESKVDQVHVLETQASSNAMGRFSFPDYCSNGAVAAGTFENLSDEWSSDSVQPALSHLFDESSLEKVSLEFTQKQNKEINLFRQSGFSVEGVFQGQHFDGENYIDVVRLGMTKKTWSVLRKNSRPDLSVGDSYEELVVITRDQIKSFADTIGDHNPIHLDDQAAQKLGLDGAISHGLLGGSVFSKILGTKFPGPGTIYLSQSFDFKKPVYPGHDLKVALKILSKVGRRLCLETQVRDEQGDVLVTGEAQVLVSKEPISGEII